MVPHYVLALMPNDTILVKDHTENKEHWVTVVRVINGGLIVTKNSSKVRYKLLFGEYDKLWSAYESARAVFSHDSHNS